MGCGSSSSNWEAKFQDAELRHRRSAAATATKAAAVAGGVQEVQVGVPSCGSLPDLSANVSVSIPDVGVPDIDAPALPSLCCAVAMPLFSIVVTVFDLFTNISVLLRFGSVGVGRFPFVFSLSVLAVGPHVLTVYEFVNDVGVADGPFCWWQVAVNQVHARPALQTVLRFARSKAGGGADVLETLRVRSLQVKMIQALSVALPQVVLQLVHLLGNGATGDGAEPWDVVSVVVSIIALGEAMGEFTIRGGDGHVLRWLHILFSATSMGALFVGFAFLVRWSLAAGMCAATGVFAANFLLVYTANRVWAGFSASRKPLTLLTDAALYTIGFVDVNWSHPAPDKMFAATTLTEALLYLLIPLASASGRPHEDVVVPLGGSLCGASVAQYALLRVLKRGKGDPSHPTPK